MKLRGIRLRTLMILVIAVALPIEPLGLGRRSRDYAARARDAAQAERVNRDVARNSGLAASQAAQQADRLSATDPAKAAALRARADLLLNSIPFFGAQAGRAASTRMVMERAAIRPWEGGPPVPVGLASTPPVP